MNDISRSKQADSGKLCVRGGDPWKHLLRGAATIFDLSGRGVCRNRVKLGSLASDLATLHRDYSIASGNFRRVLGEELARVKRESDGRRH
jgi:hypothetical protein